MPVRSDTYYTREMVLAIPEDRNRYELVYGELLMSPSPVMRHQVVLGRLYAMMYAYLEQVPVGRVLFSPADITWGSDADILVRPDLFVVAPGDVAKADWDDLRNFLLFAEVLSPSTARYDRFTKRRLYQEMKVPLYWVLDPVARQVEIWTPEALTPRFERERLAWQPDRDTASLAIELQKLFVE